jgi:hypothetical protein
MPDIRCKEKCPFHYKEEWPCGTNYFLFGEPQEDERAAQGPDQRRLCVTSIEELAGERQRLFNAMSFFILAGQKAINIWLIFENQRKFHAARLVSGTVEYYTLAKATT